MLTNPRADRVRSVRALSKRSVRERTGRFAVEGPQGVREAVRWAGSRVRDVYLTPEALERYADDIVEPARAAELWVHEVTPEVLAAMAETDAPQGVLAVVDTAAPALEEVLGRPAPPRAAHPRARPRQRGHRHPGRGRGRRRRGARQRGLRRRPRTQGRAVHGRVAVPPPGRHRPRRRGDPGGAGGARHPHAMPPTVPAPRCCPTRTSPAPHCWVMGNEAWGLDEEVRDRLRRRRARAHPRPGRVAQPGDGRHRLSVRIGRSAPRSTLRRVACAPCRSRSGFPTTWPPTAWSSSPTASSPRSARTRPCAS